MSRSSSASSFFAVYFFVYLTSSWVSSSRHLNKENRCHVSSVSMEATMLKSWSLSRWSCIRVGSNETGLKMKAAIPGFVKKMSLPFYPQPLLIESMFCKTVFFAVFFFLVNLNLVVSVKFCHHSDAPGLFKSLVHHPFIHQFTMKKLG